MKRLLTYRVSDAAGPKGDPGISGGPGGPGAPGLKGGMGEMGLPGVLEHIISLPTLYFPVCSWQIT